MGRQRKSRDLQVALNGRRVGTLTRGSDGAVKFAYDNDWLDWEHAIPVSYSLPLSDKAYAGEPVIAVFDNLLPDEVDLRRRVAERVGAEGIDPFSMLSVLGKDCIGALQFLDMDAEASPPRPPQGTALSTEDVAKRVRALPVEPLGMRSADHAFRISLAGAQDKTALLYHDGKWLEPDGATPTTHIIKPQIGNVPTAEGVIDMTDSVQNEHFCMSVMRALGFDVAETEILRLDEDLLALNITRFDRKMDARGRLIRLPQEDLCQALGVPSARKYDDHGGPGLDDCLTLLKSSDHPANDRGNFLKAQIAFWMIGATDGHAKNFSVFIRPQGRFSMTPLYDILSTQWNLDRRQIPRNRARMAMAFGKNRHYKIEDILPRHIQQTAQRNGISDKSLDTILQGLITDMPGAFDHAIGIMPDCVPDEMMSAVRSAAHKRAGFIRDYLSKRSV